MPTQRKPFWLRLLILVVLVLGMLAVIFESSIWQFDRLSAQFRPAAKSIFVAIESCEPSRGQSASACGPVFEDAEHRLAGLQAMARTQGDQRAAIFIGAYLHRTEKCRQDLETHQPTDDNCDAMSRDLNMLHRWLRYGAWD